MSAHLGSRAVSTVLAVVLAAGGVAVAAERAAASTSYALPADVTPSLTRAAKDKERLIADGCIGLATQTKPRACVYGEKTSSFTVALVGDSHLSHLFPALERIALNRGWRLVIYIKISCQWVDFLTRYPSLDRNYPECQTWNQNVIDLLNAKRPNLTIFGMSHWIYPVKREYRTISAKADSIARMLGRVPGRRILIADTLISAVDVPTCLANNQRDIRPCATPRSRAYTTHLAIESRAANQAGIPLVDIAGKICSTDPCPAVVNKMIIYRDYHHLTATFSRSLTRALERRLEPLL
jgi:hypothetical protein